MDFWLRLNKCERDEPEVHVLSNALFGIDAVLLEDVACSSRRSKGPDDIFFSETGLGVCAHRDLRRCDNL